MKKEIRDIGIAAYLLLHSFKLSSKKDRSFIFDIVPEREKEFEDHIFFSALAG